MYTPSRIADANEQSESELRMLQEFIAHSNVAGISFPHSSVELRVPEFGYVAVASDIKDVCCDGFEHKRGPIFDLVLKTLRNAFGSFETATEELPEELRKLAERWPYLTNFTMRNPVAALAQHHGIPTRLLDWSYDSRKAAFFACTGVDCCELDSSTGRVAVFALNPFMLRNRFPSAPDNEHELSDENAAALILSRHSVFVEKTDTTSYLAAQEGLFTYPEYADLHLVLTGEYPTIDRSIEQLINWRESKLDKQRYNPNIRDYIRKVTLPYSQVDSLMDLLDDERIMLTTLMPNLDRFKECMLSRHERKVRLNKRITTPAPSTPPSLDSHA